MSALEAEEDTSIEIEPPPPKRKKIATLKVLQIFHISIYKIILGMFYGRISL